MTTRQPVVRMFNTRVKIFESHDQNEEVVSRFHLPSPLAHVSARRQEYPGMVPPGETSSHKRIDRCYRVNTDDESRHVENRKQKHQDYYITEHRFRVRIWFCDENRNIADTVRVVHAVLPATRRKRIESRRPGEGGYSRNGRLRRAGGPVMGFR